ncbi:restriction endonuclease [Pseudomonas putida]|uniref:restriction endonuclease n=1 Tax=Pseudomonas putida TaxID=303 RepID=UPI00390677DC
MQVQEPKPPLYRGHPIPLQALSPSAFEDFTYQALSRLAKKLGFEMKSGPQPSSDQGYDCTARTGNGQHLICIQCKRYESALSVKTVAEEIIKVSLDKSINGSDPKQHYIITSGDVSGPLRKAARQSNYTDLKQECQKIIARGRFQPALLDKAKKLNLDSIQIALDYIDTLDSLTIWSGTDFKNELITIWSELSDILDTHFSIEKILKDCPTPDFDIRAYLNKATPSEESLIPLSYTATDLPSKLTSGKELLDFGNSILTTTDIVELLKRDNNIAISSPGGSGKSSTLSLIKNKLNPSESDIDYLPVKLKLRGYSRNTLNHMIEKELEILFGSWKSLPFKFVFLLDGLDEMLQSDTQAFLDDLESTINGYNYIITLRDKGLGAETNASSINCCLSIQPLSYRAALNIAKATFEAHELDQFYEQYRSRLGSVKFDFFSSPFVLSRSIDYYKKNKTLPTSTEEILEDWISGKLDKDQSRVTDTGLKTNKLPKSKVIDAFSTVLYNANFDYGISSIPEDSYTELMIKCHEELVATNPYLSKLLDFSDFLGLITEYEILYKGTDSHYSTPHLIISDYLASKTLAKQWRDHQDSEFNNSHYDIWLYSSNFILESERKDFLETVFKFDISLAAKIARKFQGVFLDNVERDILKLEVSDRVLTRSSAIYALGILATEKSLARLKSQQGYVDSEHPYQRLRALALSGDEATLSSILIENEKYARGPGKISGGNYELWFRSPPTVITNIARKCITKWRDSGQPGLCMSLRTLALFGDTADREALSFVLEHTDHSSEFYDASHALFEIDREIAAGLLIKISGEDTKFSYYAKKVLASKGIEFNADREFNHFIEASKQSEAYLAQHNIGISLSQLVDLLKATHIDSHKINTLISVYNQLNFERGFYFYNLIWSLGRSGNPGGFLPLIEQAYSRKNPDEINLAIGYIANFPDMDLSEELALQIDQYFDNLNGQYAGIFYQYIVFYSKTKPKKFTLGLIKEKLSQILKDLTPEKISIENYKFGIFSKYNLLFDLLNVCASDENCIAEEDAYKLLLINTDQSDTQSKQAKLAVLNRIPKQKLDEYLSKVSTSELRIYIASYMLSNDLTSDPVSLAEEFLPVYLSHNFFYSAILSVCSRHWNDRLANTFLNQFCHFDWHPHLAEIFVQNTNLYLGLFTKEQLENFESTRTAPINEFVKRTYRIFLESKGLDMK